MDGWGSENDRRGVCEHEITFFISEGEEGGAH